MTPILLLLALSTPGGAEDQAAAKSAFERAAKHFEVGEFEEALPLFLEAYDRAGHDELLFNIAQCHRNLGHFERAIFFFERYLQSPTATNVESVRGLVRELEARAAQAASAATVTAPPPPPALAPPIPPPDAPSLASRWWFWAILAAGTLAVAGATWGAVEAATPGETIPTIDYRRL